jgi:hypothetical protein
MADEVALRSGKFVQIVLVATQWGNAEGGINAFNKPFAKGLALVGRDNVDVICAVAAADEPAIKDALAAGVRLVEVGSAATDRGGRHGSQLAELLRRAGVEGDVDIWVGHDVLTGFAAAAAAAADGGRAALIHHMAYESYKNLWGGRGEYAAAQHDEQIGLFTAQNAILFGVGEYLQRSAARLGDADAHLIVPGFPDDFGRNSAGDHDLHAIVAGRFDAGTEPLKQSRLAAAGLGRAVRLAGDQWQPLFSPTLSVFGATAKTIASAELERLATAEAGRVVNVVPTGFDASLGVGRHLARANLAIMPSVREGFGLIGWEAIGCNVPLILGDQTGLHSFLNSVFDGHAGRWVGGVPLTGGDLDERDIMAMAEAIVDVARDLEHARNKAASLRLLLKDKLGGCTWAIAAQNFLHVCELLADGPSGTPRVQVGRSLSNGTQSAATSAPSFFQASATNHRRRCAELGLEHRVGQGSTHRRFDVLATLRFGVTELAIDDLDVSIGVRRALVHVTSDHGWLSGDRLGEGSNAPAGIVASAGGVWELTNPDGGVLKHKVLGDEVLCRVETPPNLPAHANVEVTVAKNDVICDFSPRRKLRRSTEKVMKIFLENALFQKGSGHVLLSSAELREEL